MSAKIYAANLLTYLYIYTRYSSVPIVNSETCGDVYRLNRKVPIQLNMHDTSLIEINIVDL